MVVERALTTDVVHDSPTCYL